ncbi:MAG: helix-turn-helix domain-containing protein [Crocinitomicaceae bacterium]
MKLQYSTFKDEDLFVLTDFNCEPAQQLLNQKGLYKVVWSRETDLTISIDGYDVPVKKDHVIFCTPLNVMEVPIDTAGIISFVFNKEFFCVQTHDEQVSCNGFLFFGSSQPQVVELCEKEKLHFEMMLSQFQEDFNTKDHLQGEMLRSSLKRMLIMSTRKLSEKTPELSVNGIGMETIRRFNLLVEEHFREKHQVQEYADLLFKSPKTLSNLFHKYGEKTPLHVIHERIILEAKRLLLYSDKTTDEITSFLGYVNPGHFSKFFKKHEGLSPSAFRQQKRALADF